MVRKHRQSKKHRSSKVLALKLHRAPSNTTETAYDDMELRNPGGDGENHTKLLFKSLPIPNAELENHGHAQAGASGSSPPAAVQLSGAVNSTQDTNIKVPDKAASMMSKMGWTPGKGLGKNRSGILTPLTLKRNDDKAGIGSKKPTVLSDMERIIEQGSKAFSLPSGLFFNKSAWGHLMLGDEDMREQSPREQADQALDTPSAKSKPAQQQQQVQLRAMACGGCEGTMGVTPSRRVLR
jgi:hypothetical protein